MRRLGAALVLAVVAAAPADAQREEARREQGGIPGRVRSLTGELRDFVAGPPSPPRRGPQGLRPCGSLYGPEARQIARGPELLNSYDRWIRASYAVIQEIGPLPVCFEYGRDTLTSNQGRYLLEANNQFLRQHRDAAFVLTGYSDPQERNPALALRRAEEIQARSAARDCRYRPRRGPTQVAVALYRKVEYSPDPAASACRPPAR
jgi:outer membrane protein OmpA-like peptidoglycan-associated protein